ncbi:MAG: AIR synthase-related protein, partial [Actinomycetota bacterium]|nr:AIR synthase-related protein [Actinomycetota bacterium]
SAVQAAVREAIREGLLRSAHDCSEGGIAVALAESCMAGDVGADIHLEDDLVPVASLFSESQSRIVVSVAEGDTEALFDLLARNEVPYSVLGTVGGDRLAIAGPDGALASATLEQMRAAFEPTLEALVHGQLQSEELREG